MNDYLRGEIREIFSSTGAVITGSHVVYTSGKHGSAYVNKDAIYPHTHMIGRLCEIIATHFSEVPIDTVVAPAVGGVIISHRVADFLSSENHQVFGVYADKVPGTSAGVHLFVINRGYDKFVKEKKVLVVEDILNTGGSVKMVIEAVGSSGGNVVGVGALCNRGGVTASELDVPQLFSLVDVNMDAWSEDDCPLCKQGVPINVTVGKGREFLARKASLSQ